MTQTKKADTVIVSDLHLGIYQSRVSLLLSILKGYCFKKLILLGDIFDHSFKPEKLDVAGQKFLDYLCVLEQISSCELIWVKGNHDPVSGFLPWFVQKSKPVAKHQWSCQGRCYLAIHGHQFDGFWPDSPFFVATMDKLIEVLRRLDSGDRVYNLIKARSTTWQRICEEVSTKALAAGRASGANFVFCGHIHKAGWSKEGSTIYINSGCWIDDEPSIVAISQGLPEIHKYSPCGELVQVICPCNLD